MMTEKELMILGAVAISGLVASIGYLIIMFVSSII